MLCCGCTAFRLPRASAIGLGALEKLEALDRLALRGTEPRLSGQIERVNDPERKRVCDPLTSNPNL